MSPGADRGGRIAARAQSGASLFVGMVLLYLLLAFGPLRDWFDMLGYDMAVSRLPIAGMTEQPVLVEIDDRSLAVIGRWPWPRSELARLIGGIDAAGASAIALDVLIAEAADPEDDRALVETARAIERLILPVVGDPAQPDVVVGLWPPLRDVVQHAHAEALIDDGGSVRWVLASKWLGDRRWPAMAVALSGTEPAVERFLLPFPDPAPFDRISAIDLLAGHIAPERLAGRLVLIGVSAMGTTRTFTTPTAKAITGIELQAFQTAALANRYWWQIAPWPARLALWIGMLGAATALLQAGSIGLVGLPLLGVFALLISRLTLQAGGWWLAPMPVVAAMGIGMAVWLVVERHRHGRASAIERARASATLAAMADAVIATDDQRRVVVVNDAAERMFGCERQDLLGRHIAELPLLAGLEPTANHPLVLHGRDGTRREVLISSGEISGEVGGTAFVLHDISEREQAARALAESERERLASERRLQAARRMSAVAEVSAAIAHELNQPLAALTTYAATAKLKLRTAAIEPPSPLIELVDKIAAQANRSANVVKKLRSVFEQARVPDTRQDLTQTVRETLILARSELDLPAASVELDMPAELPPVAHDRLQLQQLLLNLIRNAMDAHPRPSQLRIVISGSIAADGKVQLAVDDNGPGIEPDLRDDIFEPLASTKAHGLGIGLAVCRSIAEAHRGTLWLETSAFGGARFVLSLPHKN